MIYWILGYFVIAAMTIAVLCALFGDEAEASVVIGFVALGFVWPVVLLFSGGCAIAVAVIRIKAWRNKGE